MPHSKKTLTGTIVGGQARLIGRHAALAPIDKVRVAELRLKLAIEITRLEGLAGGILLHLSVTA